MCFNWTHGYRQRAGRAILAFFPLTKAVEILLNLRLTMITETTEILPERLHQILKGVKSQCSALSNQEILVEDISIATPGSDDHKTPVCRRCCQ
ncbi:MAG: IclR family transcriptional regulator domain-containing protein [Boseongicola sp.]